MNDEYQKSAERLASAMEKQASAAPSGWLPSALALAAALGLTIEYFLEETGLGGLCPTAGCEIVGGFVRHGESLLIALGLMFFWLLAGLCFLSIRLKTGLLRTSSLVLLAAGLAFDGGIIGFQTFAIRESCLMCYGVGAALLLILLAFGVHRRSIFAVVLGLAVWSAGFLSQAFFLFPDRVPDLNETVLAVSEGNNPGPHFYYFFSLKCPYCAEVLKDLQRGATGSGTWFFCPLASRKDDKSRLCSLLKAPDFAENPFGAILRAEHTPAGETKISPRVTRAAGAAMAFMRNSGYRGVPLLIVQESRAKKVFLSGKNEIIRYLVENNHLDPGAGIRR
jgi:hypothetical protein